MPILDSAQYSLDFYRSCNYTNTLFSTLKQPKAAAQLFNYTIEVVDEDEGYEPGLSHPVNFLNYIFIAKLRRLVVKKQRSKVMQDINSQQYDKFVAKLNKTKLIVEPTSIRFQSTDKEDLKQTLKEVATLIYRCYPSINLRIICANKARQRELEKILGDAYLAVQNQKAKAQYQFFTPRYDDLYNYGNCEPSAPELPPHAAPAA